MKICILYSGGLDSFIMKHYAKINYPSADITYCYYNIGQEYAYKEIRTLPDFVKIREVDWLSKGEKLTQKEGSESGAIIIPGRNMVLAALIASQELPDEIWMGALLGETHSKSTDKNFVFTEKTSDLLSYVLSPWKDSVRVRFPLAEAGMGKFESVKWALENGITPTDLTQTSSCLDGENGNCGRCVVCFRRWGIFNQFNFTDVFNTNPLTVPENIKMALMMLEGDNGSECHYDEYRRREIMPSIYKFFNTNDYNTVKKLLQERL